MATVEGERVFLRKASGLIKSASNTDVFIYDIGLVSIGLGLGFLLFFGPAVYLGGNMYVATLIAGAAMLLVGLGMLTWTITIPRSGGIYNFGTRSMWPPLAFTLSFVEVTAWLFYGSFGAVYLAQLGIAPSVTAVGILTDNSGLESFGTDLAGRCGTFLIGSGALIVGDGSELHRVSAANHCLLAQRLRGGAPADVNPDYLRAPDAQPARLVP